MEFLASKDANSGLSTFDSSNLIVSPCKKLPVARKTIVEDDDMQVVAQALQKRPRSGKRGEAKKILKASKPECEAEEKNKRNWTKAEIEVLIALKGEMQLEFTKNAKKQDTTREL